MKYSYITLGAFAFLLSASASYAVDGKAACEKSGGAWVVNNTGVGMCLKYLTSKNECTFTMMPVPDLGPLVLEPCPESMSFGSGDNKFSINLPAAPSHTSDDLCSDSKDISCVSTTKDFGDVPSQLSDLKGDQKLTISEEGVEEGKLRKKKIKHQNK